jgi:hypothetical protein
MFKIKVYKELLEQKIQNLKAYLIFYMVKQDMRLMGMVISLQISIARYLFVNMSINIRKEKI